MFQLLIVDDEIESLEWLEKNFERELGAEVTIYTASSGRKAIGILNCVKCDVILTDIKMPGMDGISFSEQCTKILPNIKIIILTGRKH